VYCNLLCTTDEGCVHGSRNIWFPIIIPVGVRELRIIQESCGTTFLRLRKRVDRYCGGDRLMVRRLKRMCVVQF